MTVQPACPLENEINWREIGDKQVEVHVETLFENLCANDETSLRTTCACARGTQEL